MTLCYEQLECLQQISYKLLTIQVFCESLAIGGAIIFVLWFINRLFNITVGQFLWR